MHYYFAYGSNMNYNQMLERCPNAKYFGKGVLPNYTLAFTRNSRNWESAVADILVSPGDDVWGIIYTLSNEDRMKLDACEGHPTIYKRKTETIMKYNGSVDDLNNNHKNNLNNYDRLEVEIYEVVNKQLNLTPKINYLSRLQDAAFEYCFPKYYQEKLYQFGLTNYNEKLQKAIDAFLEYQIQIEQGNFPLEVQKQEEWGGANLVITGEQSRKDQLNREYPHDLVVLTSHFRELSWLVKTLYWDKAIAWQIDYTNKHYVLEQFGIAALEYQKENPNDQNPKGICLAVLYSAYKVFTRDFYKMY